MSTQHRSINGKEKILNEKHFGDSKDKEKDKERFQIDQANLEKRVKTLEAKSWFEILVTPLTIALVGFFGSMYLQEVQSEHARQLANANLESKSLEIFFQYIENGENPDQQKLALRTLHHVSDELRIDLTALVESRESYDDTVRAEARRENESAAQSVLQSVQENPVVKIARISRPADGINLRPRPLSDSQLAQTPIVPDSSVGDTICALPVGHTVEVIEEGERWTIVRTTCPNARETSVGYVSHYGGNPPLETIN